MQKIKLFISDDHSLVREGLKTLLSNSKFIDLVGEASNGKITIDLIPILNPDVILMDIDMPEINGIIATKEIINFNPKIKIIALTMHNDESLLNEMLNAGAVGYLLKNTDKENLEFAILNCYNGYKTIDKNLSKIPKSSEIQVLKSDNIKLTTRESEILILISNGFTNKQIADKLFISYKTVDTHRTALMKKVDAHNVAGLIKYAIKNKII